MINKNKSFCYRVCHIENIATILRQGLCTKDHPGASDKYIPIGNPDIIDVRDHSPVKIKGYGNLGEYVPFYFTPKSPMLFNIITGYRAPVVPKRPKSEMVVFRCLLEDLSKLPRFFFTDGQANVTLMTQHYTNLADLDKIDWDIIQKCDFRQDAGDTDKQRRYQAEFLVYRHVPIKCVESIHVYNEKAAMFVKREMAKTELMIPIIVTPGYFFD